MPQDKGEDFYIPRDCIVQVVDTAPARFRGFLSPLSNLINKLPIYEPEIEAHTDRPAGFSATIDFGTGAQRHGLYPST